MRNIHLKRLLHVCTGIGVINLTIELSALLGVVKDSKVYTISLLVAIIVLAINVFVKSHSNARKEEAL